MLQLVRGGGESSGRLLAGMTGLSTAQLPELGAAQGTTSIPWLAKAAMQAAPVGHAVVAGPRGRGSCRLQAAASSMMRHASAQLRILLRPAIIAPCVVDICQPKSAQ
jgi:hypothetical protein